MRLLAESPMIKVDGACKNHRPDRVIRGTANCAAPRSLIVDSTDCAYFAPLDTPSSSNT
jgi:hypothetical protein